MDPLRRRILDVYVVVVLFRFCLRIVWILSEGIRAGFKALEIRYGFNNL